MCPAAVFVARALHLSLSHTHTHTHTTQHKTKNKGTTTPIPRLLATGDSTFPGIGLPAVAASGAIAANTLTPLGDHWALLNELGL